MDVTARTEDRPAEEAVTREARKGYDLLVVGAEPVADGEVFDDKVGRIATSFSGPVAIASARGAHVYEDAEGRPRHPGAGHRHRILAPRRGARDHIGARR